MSEPLHSFRFRLLALLFVAMIAVAVRPAAAQGSHETFADAKNHYADADYDGALRVLTSLDRDRPDANEIATYQVFCLVALGRDDDAQKVIETLVRADPNYRPSAAEASPRVQALFDRVRQPILVEIARSTYAQGKAAFDRHDLPAAAAAFTHSIALLDEAGNGPDVSASDLRTLAVGFRDLATAPPPVAAAPPQTGAADRATTSPSASSTPPATAPATMVTKRPDSNGKTAQVPNAAARSTLASAAASAGQVYGPENTDVIRPVAVSRAMPAWQPTLAMRSEAFHGQIDILVDETGKVSAAAMSRSVHPLYDPLLLKSAKSWTFKPATKDGVAVCYRLTLDINLSPTN